MKNLFNHIVKENGSSLAEQVYNVILSEIRNDHWQEGEKLPSYSELVDMSGVSRSVFQVAFRRLEAEGFVIPVKQKGIFIKKGARSRYPVLGRLAVILGPDSSPNFSPSCGMTDTFGYLDLHHFKVEASTRGFIISLHHISKSGSITPDLTAGQNEPLKGIISMVSADCLPQGLFAIPDMSVTWSERRHGDELDIVVDSSAPPFVYLGVEDRFSVPRVSADICQATSRLTRYLIARNTNCGICTGFDSGKYSQ